MSPIGFQCFGSTCLKSWGVPDAGLKPLTLQTELSKLWASAPGVGFLVRLSLLDTDPLICFDVGHLLQWASMDCIGRQIPSHLHQLRNLVTQG